MQCLGARGDLEPSSLPSKRPHLCSQHSRRYRAGRNDPSVEHRAHPGALSRRGTALAGANADRGPPQEGPCDRPLHLMCAAAFLTGSRRRFVRAGACPGKVMQQEFAIVRGANACNA